MTRAAAWLAGALALLAACGPPEPTITIHPGTDPGARAVLRFAHRAQVTVPDLFVLRPEERAAVAVDPARGNVYAAGREGHLLVLSADDGALRWEVDLRPANVAGVPTLSADGSTLFLGDDDGTLRAFDVDGRKELWSYGTEGTIRQPPVLLGDVVYFTNSHQDVFALAASDGRWRWQYTREMVTDVRTIEGRAGLALRLAADPDTPEPATLYTGFDDGKVVALGARSGEPIWVASVAPAEGGAFVDCDSTPLVLESRGELVVAGQATGVHGLGLDDGAPRWTFPVKGAGTVVAGPGGGLLFTSSLEGVFAIDPGGRLRWRKQLDPGVLSTPVVIDGVVYINHSAMGLLAFDVEDGELLAHLETGSGISSSMPVYDPGFERLYVITNRGRLLAFDVLTGARAGELRRGAM